MAAGMLPVHGDVGQAGGKVLINLLGNAVKFTHEGRVRLRAEPGENGAWRFEVSDTGIGVPPEAQSAIFKPFQQGPGARGQGGTGLGLTNTCAGARSSCDGRPARSAVGTRRGLDFLFHGRTAGGGHSHRAGRGDARSGTPGRRERGARARRGRYSRKPRSALDDARRDRLRNHPRGKWAPGAGSRLGIAARHRLHGHAAGRRSTASRQPAGSSATTAPRV